MEPMRTLAGILTLMLVAAHSTLGERLVFARLRHDGRWNDAALALLEPRRWWAVRASWHLVSILGSGLAALLLSQVVGGVGADTVIGLTFLVSSLYWAIATRFGHPAWIVLGIIAALLLVPH